MHFFVESVNAFTGVVENHACAGVYVRQMLWTSAYTFALCSLQDVHMFACMCSLFHLALGNEDGGVQLLYNSTCCLAWGVTVGRRKDRGVVCVFSIFNAGGSVCGCMCVYTRAHTHTAQMGYSVWAQESGWDTGRARRIQMDWMLAYIYLYMCTKYTFVCIC